MFIHRNVLLFQDVHTHTAQKIILELSTINSIKKIIFLFILMVFSPAFF